MLEKILEFVVLIGVLIFVHELGHFMAAKAVGIGVPRFSIGLGPITPLRFRRGETEYVISWIPFGGYVKMASKEEQDEIEALEGGRVEHEFPPAKLFESKSVPARIFVLSAGVVMNALFAWAVFSGLAYRYGGETPITRLDAVDAEVLPEAARALADVPVGAKVERVNSEPVDSWGDIIEHVQDPRTESLRFDFAGGVPPVVVEIPGVAMEERAKVGQALRPFIEPRVGSVLPGKPAERAGLRSGDLIVEIDGEEVVTWNDLSTALASRAGEELPFVIERDGERITVPVTPAEEIENDPETGEQTKFVRIGISRRGTVRYGLGEAIVEGARETRKDASYVLFILKSMLVGKVSVREMGGPLAIAEFSAQAARQGLPNWLEFMAFLSINLAVLNLLPIPVLDGGHLVFLVMEGVRGRPVPKNLRLRLTNIGLYLLLALMIFVVVNDILRLTGR